MNYPLLIFGLILIFFGTGIGCYLFGWYWRGRYERTVNRRRWSRPMTEKERQHFDAAFRHMDATMDEVRKAFD